MTIKTESLTPRDDTMLMRVTPDGKFVAIYHRVDRNSDGNIKIYDLDDFARYKYKQVKPYKKAWNDLDWDPVFDISPSGRYIALTSGYEITASFFGKALHIWDIEQREYIDLSTFAIEYPSGNAFGVDGQDGADIISVHWLTDDMLVKTSDCGDIFVYSVSQKRLLWFVSAAAHRTDSIAFSTKTGMFAISEHTSDFRIGHIGRHVTRGSEIQYAYYGHSDGKAVITSETLHLGSYFRLWNIYSGSLIREFESPSVVKNLVFSQDDNLIAGSIHKEAHLWNVNTGEIIDVLPATTIPIGFTADNKYLVAQYGQSQIGMWNMATMAWHKLYTVEGNLSSAQVVKNDKMVALSQTMNQWLIHQIQLEV